MTQLELDPNLRPFATDRQWELVSAWAEHGSAGKAAAALGCDKALVSRAKDAVLKKAARHGYCPEYENFHTKGIPPGFVLRGQSTLADKEGKLVERWDKTRLQGLGEEEVRKLPDPKKTVSMSTMLDAEGRAIVQWIKEKPEDVAREAAWRALAEELTGDITRLEPLPPPEAPQAEDLLAAYPVGDHHMGMLAWDKETGADYDLKIGTRMLTGAMTNLVCAVDASYRPANALVVFLGDFLHYDSWTPETPTSRNQLDSDSRFPKMVHMGIEAMRMAVDKALAHHGQVHVIVEIGNHDLASSVFLMELLRVMYEREPRVTVDISPKHFHYYRFGKVLIGTHHGHGVKMPNLPLIMAADRKEDWGETEHRHWWTGHIHQSKTQAAVSAQDYSGCTVESFRIMPPTDAWAAQRGYRPHRDMTAIVLHRQFGEMARFKVNPQMLGEA